jgi:four helix bundle suffix protein
MASATSKKTELKLTGVAKASLEELRLDYEDFLRQRKLPQWDRNDRRRAVLIELRPGSADEVAQWAVDIRNGHCGQNRQCGQKYNTESIPSMQSTYPEIAANGALALITVACSLLDRQMKAQAKAFEEEGGFTERLYKTRMQKRNKGC